MPKFSVRGIWQRWRESYPKDGAKADDAITVFTGVRHLFYAKKLRYCSLQYINYYFICFYFIFIFAWEHS